MATTRLRVEGLGAKDGEYTFRTTDMGTAFERLCARLLVGRYRPQIVGQEGATYTLRPISPTDANKGFTFRATVVR